MSKHTPGPWVKAVKPTQVGRCFVIDTPDGLGRQHGHICCIYDDNTSFNMKSHEEHEANAHLIAAAPDLLEALKDVSRILDAVRYTVGLTKTQAERLKRAGAAIARAEGGQS